MVMQLFLLLSSDVNLVVLTFSSFKKMTTLMKICGSLAIVDDCHLKIAMIARPSEFAVCNDCQMQAREPILRSCCKVVRVCQQASFLPPVSPRSALIMNAFIVFRPNLAAHRPAVPWRRSWSFPLSLLDIPSCPEDRDPCIRRQKERSLS